MGDVDARGRKTDSILWICIAGWAAFTLLNAAQGRRLSATIDGVVTVATWGVHVWRRSGRERDAIAGHLTCFFMGAGLTTVSLVQGQAAAMAAWFLVATPLLAGHLLGEGAARIWSVLAVLMLATVQLSPLALHIRPEFVHGPLEIWAGAVVLVTIQLGFATVSLRAQREDIAVIRAQAEELAHARDAALAGARAKDEFLAMMSHEIRTPLNGVLGMADVMATTRLADVQREQLETIQTSGEALRVILDDILDAAKMDAGMLTLEPVPFLPRTILADCERLFRTLAEQKGLALTVEIAPELPEALLGDPHRIRQVLLNLLSNALKFTEKGAVRIRVDVEAGATSRVHAIVRDTGVGIGAEVLDKLFQPFVQLDRSSRRRFQGTGLGLTISRRLARLMGGEVWAESEPGQGSTFHFTFELVPSEPPRPPEVASSPRALSVLVVEDDEINRRVADALLTRLGHRAEMVTSGGEAVAVLTTRARDFDVVLMDMRMPDLDGLEATRRVRERVVRVHPWIVAVTANARGVDREACLEAGMDDFVTKPLSAALLQAALARVPVRSGPSG
ncbi:MAG: response regulator [Myxococcales bacterium]|nr:response regulator [Myxococcales bacterium]